MMRSGHILELQVERIGSDGDGVARCHGQSVYVAFTAPGDRVRVALGRRRGGGHEGRIVEMLAPGPGRADPPCQHFMRCGGCALQHLDGEAYGVAKLDGLYHALERVRIDRETVRPLRRVPPGRRRARLGMTRPHDPTRPVTIGFRERFGHALVDMAECPVLEARLFAVIAALRRCAAALMPPGGRAEASLTRTDSGLDLLLRTAYDPDLEAFESLAAFAAEQDLVRIVWQSSSGERPIVERSPVRMIRSGASVPFPPGAFLQASEAAEAIMIEEVAAGIGGRRPALDLFAGLGSFGFVLAEQGPVHLVEGDKRSVLALRAAARTLATAPVTVEHRDLARNPLTPADLAKYAAAVFDPPRAGSLAQAQALARSPIEVVVAVSCNPATFARDAARLLAGGFRLERVVPIDQFVWTPHLELVALFRR